MKKKEVIRAWLDEEYRSSLADDQKAAMPSHPAGYMDVDDEILSKIAGGCAPTTISTSCVSCQHCHCP